MKIKLVCASKGGSVPRAEKYSGKPAGTRETSADVGFAACPVAEGEKPCATNSKVWGRTPKGTLGIASARPEFVAQFELGAEYVVTFTKVKPKRKAKKKAKKKKVTKKAAKKKKA